MEALDQLLHRTFAKKPLDLGLLTEFLRSFSKELLRKLLSRLQDNANGHREETVSLWVELIEGLLNGKPEGESLVRKMSLDQKTLWKQEIMGNPEGGEDTVEWSCLRHGIKKQMKLVGKLREIRESRECLLGKALVHWELLALSKQLKRKTLWKVLLRLPSLETQFSFKIWKIKTISFGATRSVLRKRICSREGPLIQVLKYFSLIWRGRQEMPRQCLLLWLNKALSRHGKDVS